MRREGNLAKKVLVWKYNPKAMGNAWPWWKFMKQKALCKKGKQIYY